MSSQDTTTRQKINQVKKTNVFNDNLNYKKRKIREDKLTLEIVRDFCHATCRMDTLHSSQKIQVYNYDGSFEYHPVHIRNQSLKKYYKMFEKSDMYAVWQNENKNNNKKGEEKFPTIKYRSFTNAFCPCCLDQIRRDCANHVHVSLIKALKATATWYI